MFTPRVCIIIAPGLIRTTRFTFVRVCNDEFLFLLFIFFSATKLISILRNFKNLRLMLVRFSIATRLLSDFNNRTRNHTGNRRKVGRD